MAKTHIRHSLNVKYYQNRLSSEVGRLTTDLFDSADSVGVGHDLSFEGLVLLQALHLILNVSNILEALLTSDLQFVLDPALRLR